MANGQKIVIVHGTCGSPEGNWFSWLKNELSNLGFDVSVPRFPTPAGQSFASWRKVFADMNTQAPDQTILIGHSIGAPFVLRMAEETNAPYNAFLAVCPFAKTLGIEEFDGLNSTFVDHNFDWPRIKAGAKHRFCFAGDNDPYVPLTFSEDVAQKAGATLHVVPGGGHLNADSGYVTFPQILEVIKTIR